MGALGADRPRTIPARAGEPRPESGASRRIKDYPRSCGGTRSRMALAGSLAGLSPLVRGNRRAHLPPARGVRTIPARAGEPDELLLRVGERRDYPRSCGGTSSGTSPGRECVGLSPLVRGNRPPSPSRRGSSRTIPARAGEPRRASSISSASADYPRSCGGTVDDKVEGGSIEGLSPLVRGNHHHSAAAGRQVRTIPARAGEPTCAWGSPAGHGDYPRSCGGTRGCRSSHGRPQGLSPLVRGNHLAARGPCAHAGTIPARAGEPARGSSAGDLEEDYPRSCGGTAAACRSRFHRRGLSPLVRGNRTDMTEAELARGTIPARAGEPAPALRAPGGMEDYPRSCGGTQPELPLAAD